MSVRAALAGLILLGALPADAAPPRGKRSQRPKPTHIVVTGGELEAGAEVPAELDAGVQVSVKGGSAAKTPGGKVKATVAGPVEISGTIPGAVLGQRILADTDVYSADGKTLIGRARAGAFVQPRGTGPGKGKLTVETVGEVIGKIVVDAAQVGPDPAELVLADTAGLSMVVAAEDADLFSGKDLKGTPRMKVKKGTQLVHVEELGEAAHVKTYGAFEIEGWLVRAKVGDAGSVPTEDGDGSKPSPSHEVFTDTTLWAGSDGKKVVGTLRGGTLVGITQKPVEGRARVRTLGDVRVEGWVKMSDLEPMESSVWREE